MSKDDPAITDRRTKWWLLTISLLTLVALAFSALRDSVYAEWRFLRIHYSEILDEKASDDERSRTIANQFRIEIEQNYLPHLGAIDRCITCHTAVENPAMAAEPNPFRSHPGDFLANHPSETFGCTVCHEGQGRATESADAHGGGEHWPRPMLGTEFLYASCRKCHDDEVLYKARFEVRKDEMGFQEARTRSVGLDAMILGWQIIENARCYGCHDFEKYRHRGKGGPSLRYIASKLEPGWAYRFIENPRAFRDKTWMPQYFHVANNSSPEAKAGSQQELHAIVAYLFEKSEDLSLEPIPVSGSAVRGEELVAALGCTGCHYLPGESPPHETTLNSLRRLHGPMLQGLSTKTTARWLYNWLLDPRRYNPETKMADQRLDKQEAADIAAYLTNDARDTFLESPLPPIDSEDGGLIDTLFKAYASPAERAGAGTESKQAALGKILIARYGCFGCHDIPGFEEHEPIGVALNEVGSKHVREFDFGSLSHTERTPQAWLSYKISTPRIFDGETPKQPTERLRMPNFGFNPAEVKTVVTAMLGFMKRNPLNPLMARDSAYKEYVETGRDLVREFNCRGCHVISNDGGAIRSKVKDWLVAYGGHDANEAEDLAMDMSPPNLHGEGEKVQSRWLFEYLRDPEIVRPWLRIRMPTFAFSNTQRNALTKYFSLLDGIKFPFETEIAPPHSGEFYQAGKTLFSEDYFDCGTCHIQGDQFPAGSAARWAPDFALTSRRLKPDWVIRWLYDPQKLSPGTKMPSYFDDEYFDDSGPDDILGGDEHRQIVALRDYIYTMGAATPTPSDEGENTN